MTVNVQLAPTAKKAGQLLVSEKSPKELLPVMPKVPVPVFVNVSICGALLWPIKVAGNVSDAGVIVGTPALTLLPLTVKVCGLGRELSLSVSIPLSEPINVGV